MEIQGYPCHGATMQASPQCICAERTGACMAFAQPCGPTAIDKFFCSVRFGPWMKSLCGVRFACSVTRSGLANRSQQRFQIGKIHVRMSSKLFRRFFPRVMNELSLSQGKERG